MEKEPKIKFDLVKGVEILKGLREKVEIKLANEKSLEIDEDDCIVIPVYDNKPKTKEKDLER